MEKHFREVGDCERGKEKNLEAYECVDLDKTLSQFYAEVRKEVRKEIAQPKRLLSQEIAQPTQRSSTRGRLIRTPIRLKDSQP